ncbi:hypothetical protein V1478_005569 [Vespula squamosa]|uniref:Uncharacterized protein n=1 Tax=Vespula squamosa TaxID=30214 RepID=A0ABD2BAJ0_VESSQ
MMTPEINFMQIGVGVWPIIDSVNLDLNSKIPTAMYRKNENRRDRASGRIDYPAKSEFRKNQNETKGGLTFEVIKSAGTISGFTVCRDNKIWKLGRINLQRSAKSLVSKHC